MHTTVFWGPGLIYRSLRGGPDGRGRATAALATLLVVLAAGGGLKVTIEWDTIEGHMMAEGYPGEWQRWL